MRDALDVTVNGAGNAGFAAVRTADQAGQAAAVQSIKQMLWSHRHGIEVPKPVPDWTHFFKRNHNL